MREVVFLGLFVLVWTICVFPALGGEGSVAWWRFDKTKGRAALDSARPVEDSIQGNFRHIEGVSGSAIKWDGFTTRVIRKAGEAPQLAEAFTVEAWVAPQAYPRNWCAIVN